MSVDLKSSTYIDFNKESNKDDPELKVGDNARISKYKNIFRKRYVPNPSQEVFFIKKLKILWYGHILLVILKKNLLKYFTKKNYKEQIKKEFAVEKVMKRKGDKVYVKWEGYDNSLTRGIHKKHNINE